MHPPTFSKDFPEMLEVREDDPPGTEIGQITTNDEDLGYNGLVQYSLTTNSYFNIHLYSGHLSIRRPLTELLQQKADKSSEFWEQSLEVVVRDMALNSSLSKAAKKMVNIRIYGANMHTPAFEQPAYFLKISENNVAGQELLILRATDQDIGPKNGKVEYRLAMEASELVSVDPDTGILRLEMMAVDRGSPAKIAFANVTIEVEDVNDNAPFCSSIHKATLLEDSPNGLLIACIYAQDADLHQNAFLNYSINQQTSNKVPFRIDSATGCIFLHTDKPLDYQQTRFYNFSVQVFDQGSPPLNCSCPVEISLIDVNENILPPQFNEIALEAKNLPPKTEVLKVQAVDPEGSVVTYKLVSGNGLGFFEIHPQTGVIRTSVVLDYEACVMYWLAVRAEDDSGPFALTSHLHVLVRVLNQNDRAPTFSQPIYFTSVSENSAENKVILKIEAVDPDMSSNKNVERGSGTGVKYAIVKGNPQSNFAVDENTGYLITGKRRLDRETQSEHELHIRACDQGTPQLCTTALVVVSIMDVNDNAPIFVNPSTTTITVPADHVGLLTQVFAYDLDADAPNSNIIYEIVGNTLFSIDQWGSPSLHSNTSLTLIPISRANKLTVANRKPELREQEVWKELYVSDSDSVGTVVGIVKAMDGDSDPLWWWTTPSITSNHTFAFKTNSGELVLAKPVSSIDFSLNEIELHFMVTDGLDEISDKIKIRISRSTTSRPKFLHPNSSVELSGISPLGFVPYTAHAVFDETRTGSAILTKSYIPFTVWMI
uniref:Cadherin domain-containing protein n=1 Tax=Ditylenchus dipsaci TaxID=166011 RepID=A0A915DAN4_9BILA